MKINRFRIENFSAFDDTGDIELKPGVNLIVGQNNVGKTALISCFKRAAITNKHKSEKAFLDYELDDSRFVFDIMVSKTSVFRSLISTINSHDFYWPNKYEHDGKKAFEEFLTFADRPDHNFKIECLPQSGKFTLIEDSLSGKAEENINFIKIGRRGKDFVLERAIQGSLENGLILLLYTIFDEKIFLFTAQRYSMGNCEISAEAKLNADARNLAAFINKIHKEQPENLDIINKNLREIFPSINSLTAAASQAGFEIRIWPTNNRGSPELSFGLNDCGTGVGQVIAILSVIVSLKNAVIVIDEISTFLHPSAVKKLLRIIQSSNQGHQYIVSTHSGEVISSANPSSVHLVYRDGFESRVKTISHNDIDKLREIATHLGISAADVFGADRIVWVEGPTEELCFPYIYEKTKGSMPHGLAVLSVVATGDFFGKKNYRKSIILDIYNKISSVGSNIFHKPRYSFDTEALSESDKADLIRQSRKSVYFLPRRQIECYLLDAEAVCAFIKSSCPEAAIEMSHIVEYWNNHGGDEKFQAHNKWSGNCSDDAWLQAVDASNLIKQTVEELSESKVTFRKNNDSLLLLKHIIDNNKLSVELDEYVIKLFGVE